MRTQLLLVAAGLACWIASQTAGVAQTTSYTSVVPPGVSYIANQLDHGSNTLNEIMPSMPDGSVLYKYDNSNGNWSSSAYSAALVPWSPPNLTLSPGEGAFFQCPNNLSLTFTGNPHVPVLPILMPAYWVRIPVSTHGGFAGSPLACAARAEKRSASAGASNSCRERLNEA